MASTHSQQSVYDESTFSRLQVYEQAMSCSGLDTEAQTRRSLIAATSLQSSSDSRPSKSTSNLISRSLSFLTTSRTSAREQGPQLPVARCELSYGNWTTTNNFMFRSVTGEHPLPKHALGTCATTQQAWTWQNVLNGCPQAFVQGIADGT
jgi:hypothetical protein